MNVVFPRISSIFDPQAIFSVELLPGRGQAHHKTVNTRLSNPFNRGSWHVKNRTSLLKRAYFPRSVSDFNEMFLVGS